MSLCHGCADVSAWPEVSASPESPRGSLVPLGIASFTKQFPLQLKHLNIPPGKLTVGP